MRPRIPVDRVENGSHLGQKVFVFIFQHAPAVELDGKSDAILIEHDSTVVRMTARLAPRLSTQASARSVAQVL
jgi:hypothetical protein